MASSSRNLLGQATDHVRDHFLPHERNNHVPHVLHHRALFGMGTVMIALKALVIITSLSLPAYSVFSSAITPDNIINLTNDTRAALHLPTLRVDDKLMLAAQAKAEDMLNKGYFAHTSPTGVTPWYWFKTFDYTYRSAGENLAAHFTEAEDVQAGWMASPKHRDNIVSTRFDEIGVGVAQGVYENYPTTFVVQMFGYEVGDNHETPSSNTPAEPVSEPVGDAEPSPSVLAEVSSQPEPADETLKVDLSSLALTPLDDAYLVEIDLEHASEAVVYVGTSRAVLTPTSDPRMWQGLASYNPATMSATGERMYMVVGGWNGEIETHDLAWVMPNSATSAVYAFADHTGNTPKLLGVVDLANIDDGVQKFYIGAIIFLSAVLLIAVLAKMEVKRPTMIASTLTIIGLALVLSVL